MNGYNLDPWDSTIQSELAEEFVSSFDPTTWFSIKGEFEPVLNESELPPESLWSERVQSLDAPDDEFDELHGGFTETGSFDDSDPSLAPFGVPDDALNIDTEAVGPGHNVSTWRDSRVSPTSFASPGVYVDGLDPWHGVDVYDRTGQQRARDAQVIDVPRSPYDRLPPSSTHAIREGCGCSGGKPKCGCGGQ